MNSEEAIEYLNTLYMALAVFPNQQISLRDVDKMKESVGMAIEALEQKPCEDAISRQAVLDSMSDTWKHICFVARHKHPTKGEESVYNDMCGTINQIPSVTPQYTDVEIQKIQELEQTEIEKAYELGKAEQPETGHWIDDCGGVKCSCCGYCIDDYYYVKTYCPNCGAKMEGEVEE